MSCSFKLVRNSLFLHFTASIESPIIGPVERVAIPKEKDGKIKTFGFVTYKHLSSVGYALNIFGGTKLFGRELMLRNRNANKSRDQPQYQSNQPSNSLRGFSSTNFMSNDMAPVALAQIQHQLISMATGQNFQMLPVISTEEYASARSGTVGSYREHWVDRNRHHREENRSNRSKPYRRSRSRSPQSRSRDRSPNENRGRDRNRESSRRSDDRPQGNYHRWGKR